MSTPHSCPSSVPGCDGVPLPGTPIYDRKTLLGNLAVGDIFHASAPNGASLICLVMAVMETVVQARTITHQLHLEFDRTTGVAEWNPAKGWPGKGHPDVWVQCTIDSVAPVPIDDHEVMLFVDRRERLTYRSGDADFSEVEKDCFIFIYSYYRENPLPGAEMHAPAVEASPIEKCLAPYLIPAQGRADSQSKKTPPY